MARLDNVDLRLLQLFDLIYRHRNLSRVADQLGLTQPAVSLALAKLRQHFGDPLFVRIGGEMMPTPAADQLSQLALNAIATLEATLAYRPAFDPAQERRVFRIAMTDVGQIVVLPKLLNTLRTAAPFVDLDIGTIDDATVTQLQHGTLDIAMGFLPDMDGRFIQRPIFEESFSCLVRRSHPRISDTLTVAGYRNEQHVIVKTSGTAHLIIENNLRKKGIVRKIGVRIPNFLSLATVIGSTDLVATLPSRAAWILSEQSHARVLPLPVAMPGYQVRQHWHERMQKDPGHIWLRNLIADLFQNG